MCYKMIFSEKVSNKKELTSENEIAMPSDKMTD